MVMTTTDAWKEALNKGTVPLVVHVLIEDAKHKSTGAEIDVEWVSAPSMDYSSDLFYGHGLADPVISGITTLSSSLDPIERKVQIGEITITILDSATIRDLFENYDVVGKPITIKVGATGLSISTYQFLPYWAGLVFDIIPKDGTTIDIVCKTRLRKLAEKTWKGQVVNKNKLEAVEGILIDIGFTSADYDATSFDKAAAANSDLVHFVDSSLNFSDYHMGLSRPPLNALQGHGAVIFGGSYPTRGDIDSAARDNWPNPDGPGVRTNELIEGLLRSTYGSLSTDAASGKIKFIAWDKTKDVARTLGKEDYRGFVVTKVFGETLVNSIKIPLTYKNAVQDFIYQDTDSITRYDREITIERDLSFNIAMAAAAQGPGPQQFSAADKTLGAWTDTQNTEAEFQGYFGSDTSSFRGYLDRAYPHAIELGGYQVTGFAGTDRMGDTWNAATANSFSGELSTTTPGYYWVPDFNVVYKCTSGPVLNVLKRGDAGGSNAAWYTLWDKDGGATTATIVSSNAVPDDYDSNDDGVIFGSLRLPFFEIDNTSNEPWLPANQVWNSATGASGPGYSVGGTQSLFIDQLGTTFKPLATNLESSIATENNTWSDNHNHDMADIEYSAAEEIEVYDITQAEYYARQVLTRSANGMPTIEFSTGLGHMDLELGDFLAVKNTGVFLWRGIPCEDCKFEITKKTVDLYAGEVQFTCVFASISPAVFPETQAANVSRFCLGDSKYQSILDWENLQRLAGIDFGLKPSLLAEKGAVTKFPFIGPGKVSGGRGGPKVLSAGALMTNFPPPGYAAGVEEHVYYGMDARTGQISSFCRATAADSYGFTANTQKVIPIMRVTKTSGDALDATSLVDLRDVGGYSNPGNIVPMSQSEMPLAPSNGDISTWGDVRSLPDGWGATTLNGFPLSMWDEDTDLTDDVGVNPPTAGSMGSLFFERSTTTRSGKYSIKLNAISASDTYTVGGVTKKLVPYQWKIFTPPMKGLEVGSTYGFSVSVQSSGTGASFIADLETQDTDGSWSTGHKTESLTITSADTWEDFTFGAFIPTATTRSVRGIIKFTGYGEEDLIIDSFKVQALDVNPRGITQLSDVSTAVSAYAVLRSNSTNSGAEWVQFNNYVFQAYRAANEVIGTSSTVDMAWNVAINSNTSYVDGSTKYTWPSPYTAWICPADGYWRVRAKCVIDTIGGSAMIGNNADDDTLIVMTATVLTSGGSFSKTIESARAQISGYTGLSWSGEDQATLEVEGVVTLLQNQKIIIRAVNNSASLTYELGAGAALSTFEVTPVRIN